MACETLGFVLLAAFFVGLQIYQISHGVVLNESFKPWIYRDKKPVYFWMIVGIQSAMILGAFVGMLVIARRG